MAELKIDVQDLHKSYGNNEVLKESQLSSTKVMLFVLLVLQVQENQHSYVPSTYLKQSQVGKLSLMVMNFLTQKLMSIKFVRILEWYSNTLTFSHT